MKMRTCLVTGLVTMSMLAATTAAPGFALEEEPDVTGELSITQVPESTSDTESLSRAEIAERFQQINSSYEVGEAFSSEDAAFVLKYGMPYNQSASTNSEVSTTALESYGSNGSFETTKKKYGTTIHVKGSSYHEGTFSYTYGTKATVKKTAGKTPKKLKITIHCTSYGIIGSDGVGKIYDGEVSASNANKNSLKADISKSYAGYGVVFYRSTTVTVKTASGDTFTIS